MGSTSRYGRATINPGAPEAIGVCDRCGFLYDLRALRWQMEWAGTTMQNLHLRVCPTCLDVPQEQLRTIVLPPDPPPVADPRIEPYSIDEVNEYTIGKFVGQPALFWMTAEFEVIFGVLQQLLASISGTAQFDASPQYVAQLSASVSATASFEVTLEVPAEYIVTEGSDRIAAENNDLLTTE
jgi:hypothetical protein